MLDFSFLKDQDILLVIDNIKSDNLDVIRELRTKASSLIVAQDMGHKYNLRFKKGYELRDYFSNIDILQIKEDVIKLLLSRMRTTIEEFMSECNVKKIIVTNGKDGCSIHEYLQENYSMKQYAPFSIYDVVDSSGAGDVFFARYLFKTVICQEEGSNCDIFKFCQEGVEKVLSGIGAKYNLGIQLKKLKNEEKCDCTCLEKSKESTRKTGSGRKFKCLANYESVQRRIQTLQLNDNEQVEEVLNKEGVVLCVGTGASYISAVYVSQLLLSMGKLAVSIYPYEITAYCSDKIDEVLIFTTSGRTYDNREIAKKSCYLFKNASIRLVTTASKEILEENYPVEVVNKSIIYKADFIYQEHGFLSFWGVFGPIIYLTLLLAKKEKMYEQDLKIIGNRFNYWDNNNEISKCIDSLLDKKCETIDVIYSSEYKAAAIAIESMFTESGTCRCLLHEEKNFSHGRFVISEHSPASCVIIIKGAETTAYEKKLIEYVKKKNHLLWVLEAETEYSKVDAIIAVYSWMVQYSLKINRDVSKPAYSSDSMKLYKFK